MTPQQATETMAALTAAWPNTELPEPTLRLWLGILTEQDQRDAIAAAKKLVRIEHFFPSIARFLTESDAEAHARRNRLAASRGLPRRHDPVAPSPRLLETARTLLAEQGKRKHWHGGPTPCEVCGGMATPKHLPQDTP